MSYDKLQTVGICCYLQLTIDPKLPAAFEITMFTLGSVFLYHDILYARLSVPVSVLMEFSSNNFSFSHICNSSNMADDSMHEMVAQQWLQG